MIIKAADILKFFEPDSNHKSGGKIVPKSVGDFYNAITDKESRDMMQLGLIIKRLSNEGLLIHSGTKAGMGPLFNDCYYCFGYKEQLAKYGTYDFVTHGFPYIREHFEKSVRPIVIKFDKNANANGKDYGIGTYFVIGDNFLVTARHCLPPNSVIKITDPNNTVLSVESIHVPNDSDIDIAIVKTNGNPFLGINHFKIGKGNLLDEVITMGYPDIPGFDAIQVTDNIVIAGNIKATTGRLIGSETSYLDGRTYFLINARVKGGNSGGPLINKRGEVIGIIAQLPEESSKIDLLGYGIATPFNAFLDFINEIRLNQSSVKTVQPENTNLGFRIKNQL